MTRPVGKGMIPSVNRMTLINIRDRNAAPPKRLKQDLALLSVLLLVLLGGAAGPATDFAAEAKRTVPTDRPVSYEALTAIIATDTDWGTARLDSYLKDTAAVIPKPNLRFKADAGTAGTKSPVSATPNADGHTPKKP